jgi:hypothetical protein
MFKDADVFQDLGQVLNKWAASSRNAEIADTAETFRNSKDEVVFDVGSNEMLRIDHSGFWVRGQRVDASDQEAVQVYQAFKDWLVWSQLNRL